MLNFIKRFLEKASANQAAPTRGPTIVVGLPEDRTHHGNLVVLGPDGDLMCSALAVSGRADRSIAARYGNPEASRTRKYGDTSLGRYIVVARKSPNRTSGNSLSHVFCGMDVLVCKPVDGECLIAEAAGRGYLLVHGGGKHLSNGSLILPETHMKRLLEILPQEIKESSGIFVEVVNDYDFLSDLDDDGFFVDFDEEYGLLDFDSGYYLGDSWDDLDATWDSVAESNALGHIAPYDDPQGYSYDRLSNDAQSREDQAAAQRMAAMGYVVMSENAENGFLGNVSETNSDPDIFDNVPSVSDSLPENQEQTSDGAYDR